ncbi:MAG TPA: D-alanyl-D-alanine carboxypeptidase family protein [bacterium]|nr:D-alanyl-D-alanine carboxypeptidase family protein [bacterium]
MTDHRLYRPQRRNLTPRVLPPVPAAAAALRRAAALAVSAALVLGVTAASVERDGMPLVAGLPGRVPAAGSARGLRRIPQAVLPPVVRPSSEPAYRPWDVPSIRHSLTATTPVRITATAAILVDGRSGQVLYDRNAHLIWPPASTTKIMTALVAVESTPLSTPITISPNAAHFRDGSVVGLPEGARIPLHDLLYALLLPSGNDVAIAIAEGTAGTVSAFVARMNDEARRLGATQTHFGSPHGLYTPDNYTTAYDLTVITRAALRNPTIADIVRTKRWMFQVPGYRARVLTNHNKLLSRFPGADGVKTGYVDESGLTLVASATRDGWRLIAVVLHTHDMWGDSSRLLSYGFAHFRPKTVALAGERLAVVQLPSAKQTVVGTVPGDVTLDTTPGEAVGRIVSLAADVSAPVRRGEQIGEVAFSSGGKVMQISPLVAADDVITERSPVEEVVNWIGHLGHFLGAAVF